MVAFKICSWTFSSFDGLITVGFDDGGNFVAVWVGNVVEVDDEKEIEDAVSEEEAEGFEERRLLEGVSDGEK